MGFFKKTGNVLLVVLSTLSSLVTIISACFIEDFRNFLWNNGWLILFLVSLIIIIVIIIIIIKNSKILFAVKLKLNKTEDKLRETEDKLRETEDKLRETKDNLTKTERKLSEYEEKISETDIKTYNKAMSFLNYPNVDYYLNEHDMGGPLIFDDIKMFYSFNNFAHSTEFHFRNEKLRKLIFEFRDALKNFTDKLSLFTSTAGAAGDLLKMSDELERRDRKEWERQREELNTLATKAHDKFENLIKFAIEKEIDKHSDEHDK